MVYVSDHSTVAVSYTHLDVYKRQVQGRNPINSLILRNASNVCKKDFSYSKCNHRNSRMVFVSSKVVGGLVFMKPEQSYGLILEAGYDGDVKNCRVIYKYHLLL